MRVVGFVFGVLPEVDKVKVLSVVLSSVGRRPSVAVPIVVVANVAAAATDLEVR